MAKFIMLMLAFTAPLAGQTQQTPYTERFDSTLVPLLPPGWQTSNNRSPSGDFTTTSSAPRSSPNAVISTGSTIPQSLTTTGLDFTDRIADSLKFYERRSSTYNAAVVLEASVDGGQTFSVRIGDTLRFILQDSYLLRAMALPQEISNRSGVLIRWRSLGNGTGTTGTLRFDDVVISARAQYDASVDSIRITPALPYLGDSVSIDAYVRNSGTASISNVAVEFYIDANFNGLPDPPELFHSRTIHDSLSSGQSIAIRAITPTILQDSAQAIVRAVLVNDINPGNNIKSLTFFLGLRRLTVAVNEVMYAPASGESEWIEMRNNSTQPIDIRNWKITNRNPSPSYMLTTVSRRIDPDSFLVVTKDTALLRAKYPVLTTSILQSSSLPTFYFNNTGDAVVLYDSRGAVMDSMHYLPSWGGSGGRSLERIESLLGSLDSLNWGSSADSMGATPGRLNSNSPLEHDLAVKRVQSVLNTNTNHEIRAIIVNVGKQSASAFSATLYIDANQDSVAQPSEFVDRTQLAVTLLPRDSVIVPFRLGSPQSGKVLYIVEVEYPLDERMRNNVGFGGSTLPFAPQSVIINEIMYEPRSEQAEWVELFNPGDRPVDVRGWLISDQRNADGKANEFTITKNVLILPPGAYLVVASDSSIYHAYPELRETASVVVLNRSSLSLNNTGDDVVVSDLARTIIDSVRYTPSWHNPDLSSTTGRSLERINPALSSTDPRNWTSCAHASGGTPGRTNSVYTVAAPSPATLAISPNPFSPDGDGFEDVSMLTYQLESPANLIRVRIYDSAGRLVRTLANGEPGGARGQLIWDGYTDHRERARMGAYIVLFEVMDAGGGTTRAIKGVVVVAARL
jgi:hypothetical protein